LEKGFIASSRDLWKFDDAGKSIRSKPSKQPCVPCAPCSDFQVVVPKQPLIDFRQVPTPQPRPASDILVTLKNVCASSSIGLKVSAGNNCLVVMEVKKEGLVAEWNQRNPGRQVGIGDALLTANGHPLVEPGSVTHYAQDNVLQLHLRRVGLYL